MRGTEIELTSDLVDHISNWGEHVFAQACTERLNLVVKYQIPVGEKLIDFQVVNTSYPDLHPGKLVEVTCTPERNARKNGQKRAMEASGCPFTVLYGENLSKIEGNRGT